MDLSSRRAFEKLLDSTLAHQVDFVIIAGDLYDVGLKSFGSALFFNRQMTRLKEAGINVSLIHGNHDAASKLIKQLRPPANVHVFRSNEPQTFRRDVLHLPVLGVTGAPGVVHPVINFGYATLLQLLWIVARLAEYWLQYCSQNEQAFQHTERTPSDWRLIVPRCE